MNQRLHADGATANGPVNGEVVNVEDWYQVADFEAVVDFC
jgi:hypothetical protein